MKPSFTLYSHRTRSSGQKSPQAGAGLDPAEEGTLFCHTHLQLWLPVTPPVCIDKGQAWSETVGTAGLGLEGLVSSSDHQPQHVLGVLQSRAGDAVSSPTVFPALTGVTLRGLKADPFLSP